MPEVFVFEDPAVSVADPDLAKLFHTLVDFVAATVADEEIKKPKAIVTYDGHKLHVEISEAAA